ncbi:MAG: ABC transporter permease [Lewinellaceae bacterium]|nr:ABC transporter permease [Saprospiraceae bacterium]MCB9341629.1 ABC transporter permease [Lewinellaceae bacterium]
MQRVIFNFILAVEGVVANTLRAVLTALGIVFGVAAVIAMLAIGSGAKQSILEQMKLIGTNNIVIKSVVLKEGEGGEETANTGSNSNNNNNNGKRPWSPGLTLEDLRSMEVVLPNIERASPEIVLPTNLVQAGKTQKAKCVGVTNAFFELNNLHLSDGNLFHKIHLDGGKPVCIIGHNVRSRFFPEGNAVGEWIKCGTAWMQIIGVLEKRSASKESLENLGIRDYNSDVYVPVSTALLRIQNRARITSDDIQQDRDDDNDKAEEENYHQLDKIVLRVKNSSQLKVTAEVAAKILKRRHKDLLDFEVEVPELLLEQQQKTQDMFNFVLAVIAGISLLVGGIGIMNIMLASVLERIKEIGVRRSLGAKQNDIVLQFLFEAVFISLLGGIIGIILGVVSAKIIANGADIPTVVSGWSIALSFGVAATVGLVFGLFPARKAARQDPIKALRTD